jgi:tRNA-uridine 2-sulfurtransferase
MEKKGRVLMAMSGGVDSSVAAILLHRQGYEIIGITMKTWDYASSGGSTKETGCCSLDSINDARTLAVRLGFPHYVLDLKKEFEDLIISNFVSEYLSGRTPNPCVLCNTFVKWDALLKKADLLNCDYIATGHYAGLRFENGRYIITKGIDELKDQSYVLWGLSQENLRRTLFPLGGFKKSEIKKMAHDNDFENLAKKSESYEICFIPDNDYRAFLDRKVGGLKEKLAGGDFLSVDGKVLGQHKGFPFYTIGQRKGLEIALGEPMYVKEIRHDTNSVVLGRKSDLNRLSMEVDKINLIKYSSIDEPIRVLTKIRYHDKGTMGLLSFNEGIITIDFEEDVVAIAPGQSAVFYEGDDIVGGGLIK